MGDRIQAEADKILLRQMEILQEQTQRMINANSATPAAGISALSHEIAELARVVKMGRGCGGCSHG